MSDLLLGNLSPYHIQTNDIHSGVTSPSWYKFCNDSPLIQPWVLEDDAKFSAHRTITGTSRKLSTCMIVAPHIFFFLNTRNYPWALQNLLKNIQTYIGLLKIQWTVSTMAGRSSLEFNVLYLTEHKAGTLSTVYPCATPHA